MNVFSSGLRRAAAIALLTVGACGNNAITPHTRAVVQPQTSALTLRFEEIESTIEPSTLSIASRGVSLSEPLTNAAKVTDLSSSHVRVTFKLPEQGLDVDAQIKDARFAVRMTSSRAQRLDWPRPSSRDARRIALPIAEGLSIPPRDSFWQARLASKDCRTAYGGLSMPFFGIDRERGSFAVILASDLGTRVCGSVVDGQLTEGVQRDFAEAGESYEVVFAPTDGTPIGSALAYRAWLRAQNAFVSLADKTRAHPHAARLAGAIHAYLWGDGASRAAIDELSKLGVDRALIAFDDDKRLVTSDLVRYAESREYLMARYDTFDSVMDPKTADSPVAIFDDELFRTGGILDDSGKRMPGFAGRGLQLSSEALRRAKTPFIDQRIAAAKALGSRAYFVDSDAFGELLEDFDPAHPMTRARDRENRLVRMRAIADAGFVVGSESAVAWSSPAVVFSHGNETIALDAYWDLLKNRERMGKWAPQARPSLFFKEVTLTDDERRELLDPGVRVPLYQAVFHDSVVTTDRWEMPLMKTPGLVVPRTLFTLLYGVPTIWSFDRKALREHGPRLAALVKFFAPLHRMIATMPLESFAYLSRDGRLQRTRFGSDVEVTANFSGEERASIGAAASKYARAPNARRSVRRRH